MAVTISQGFALSQLPPSDPPLVNRLRDDAICERRARAADACGVGNTTGSEVTNLFDRLISSREILAGPES